MFIHAFSTKLIQIQGPKNSLEIKAIHVEKGAFIRGCLPRRPVIPDKHFSIKRIADAKLFTQPGRQMHHSLDKKEILMSFIFNC